MNSEEEKTDHQTETTQSDEDVSNDAETKEENIVYIIVMFEPTKEHAKDVFSTLSKTKTVTISRQCLSISVVSE